MAEPIWKDIDDPNCSNLMDCCDYVDSIMQTLFISEVSYVLPALANWTDHVLNLIYMLDLLGHCTGRMQGRLSACLSWILPPKCSMRQSAWLTY